jgi:hypothetical protein
MAGCHHQRRHLPCLGSAEFVDPLKGKESDFDTHTARTSCVIFFSTYHKAGTGRSWAFSLSSMDVRADYF